MEHLKHILNIFRTHNIVLYILFICSGVITFDVYGLRKVLGIDLIGQPYIAFSGLLFLICLASFLFLLVNSVFGNLFSKFKSYLTSKTQEKELNKNIEGLSNREVRILLEYFIKDTDTVWLPLQGAEITSLVRKKIIFLSQVNGRGMTNGMQIFHYSVYPFVKDKFIEKYPQFFGDDFDKQKISKFMRDNTPSYITEINEMNKRWNIF